MRGYLVPDRRAQDFQKVRLLCVSSLSERQRQRIADSVRENPIEPPHVHLLLQPGSTTNDSGAQTHSSFLRFLRPLTARIQVQDLDALIAPLRLYGEIL